MKIQNRWKLDKTNYKLISNDIDNMTAITIENDPKLKIFDYGTSITIEEQPIIILGDDETECTPLKIWLSDIRECDRDVIFGPLYHTNNPNIEKECLETIYKGSNLAILKYEKYFSDGIIGGPLFYSFEYNHYPDEDITLSDIDFVSKNIICVNPIITIRQLSKAFLDPRDCSILSMVNFDIQENDYIEINKGKKYPRYNQIYESDIRSISPNSSQDSYHLKVVDIEKQKPNEIDITIKFQGVVINV